MTRLSDGECVYVPAGYVHLAFHPQHEPMLTTPISTGLAFDPAVETAIWRGLCEVAERDAMMLTWWQRRPAPEIDMRAGSCSAAGLPAALADRLDRLERVKLTARFFDITTDFNVPTVFCVLSGSAFPYRIVGACCREDLGAACIKALDEAVAVRRAVGDPGIVHAGEPAKLRLDNPTRRTRPDLRPRTSGERIRLPPRQCQPTDSIRRRGPAARVVAATQIRGPGRHGGGPQAGRPDSSVVRCDGS